MLIALGVTGGIGAYKAVEVARGLQKRGHDVVAVMTRAATRFVGPVTFEAITRRHVITDQFAREAIKKNLDTLAARGVRFVEPGEGYLACGWIGKGRLAEPEEIVAAAESVLGRAGPLRGQRVLVTAGPTYEDFDPVRFVGNRSSGKMGFAVAAEAVHRGAEVTLISGPSALEPPPLREFVRVRTAAQMHAAVMARAGDVQVVVMAAAVADYAPDRAPHKVQKANDTLTLVMHRTPDILADLGLRRRASGRGPVLVGFAAETQDVVTRATEKREKKHADLIVANDVARTDAGFDVDSNAVTIVGAEGVESLPLQSKARVAAEILDRGERLLESRTVVR